MKDAIWPSEACQRSGGSTCKSTIVAEFGNRRVFLQELLECTTLHTFLAFAEPKDMYDFCEACCKFTDKDKDDPSPVWLGFIASQRRIVTDDVALKWWYDRILAQMGLLT